MLSLSCWSSSAAACRSSSQELAWLASMDLDNVSCSPFRVPVARLEAGRAAVTSGGSDTR
ncbi:MAG: hypothetical protein ABSA02_16510 [Trebonia sp.]